MQIPANAAWFYVLAVLAASPYPIETRQRVRRLRSRHASAAIPETPVLRAIFDGYTTTEKMGPAGSQTDNSHQE